MGARLYIQHLRLRLCHFLCLGQFPLSVLLLMPSPGQAVYPLTHISIHHPFIHLPVKDVVTDSGSRVVRHSGDRGEQLAAGGRHPEQPCASAWPQNRLLSAGAWVGFEASRWR